MKKNKIVKKKVSKKKNMQWRFTARISVNKYYFKRTLVLHSICAQRIKEGFV